MITKTCGFCSLIKVCVSLRSPSQTLNPRTYFSPQHIVVHQTKSHIPLNYPEAFLTAARSWFSKINHYRRNEQVKKKSHLIRNR